MRKIIPLIVAIILLIAMPSLVMGQTKINPPFPIPKSWLDTDTALTANSDTKIPSQKAVKAYADALGGAPTAAAGGTVDAITATYSPAVTLTNGTRVILVAAGANTTAVTFTPNALTTKAIVKYASTALVAGDIPAASYPCDLEYNGTAWVLLNPAIETRLGGANAPSAAEISKVHDAFGGSFQAQISTLDTDLNSGADPGHAHTKIINAASTTAADMFPLFSATQGGDYAALTNVGFKINPNTGLLTAPGFSGPLTGNITGNVSGSAGSCTGNAGSATYASAATIVNDAITNATMYPVWVTANTGNLPVYVSSTKFSFNPAGGSLSVIQVGPISSANTLNIGSAASSTTANIHWVTIIPQIRSTSGTNSGLKVVGLFGGATANMDGIYAGVYIDNTWNLATATSEGLSYDLLINRTETNLSTGIQRLISAQVAGVEKFGVATNGKLIGLPTTNGPCGTGTLTAGTTTTVNNTAVSASSLIFIQPTNAAGTVLGIFPPPSGISAGVSFTLTHLAAAGTETFSYWIMN